MTDKTGKKSSDPSLVNPLFSMNQFNPALDWIERWSKAAPQVASGVPGFGQWIAPTLDPKELERRINELRTVQFWLEQNTRMVATTIQALEVQRMTLNTLQGMNVPMTAAPEPMKPAPSEGFTPPVAAMAADTGSRKATGAKRGGAKAKKAGDVAAAISQSGIDAMNWWNAMTDQFSQLATQAMKDVAAATPPATGSPAKKVAPASRAGATPAKTARTKPATPRR